MNSDTMQVTARRQLTVDFGAKSMCVLFHWPLTKVFNYEHSKFDFEIEHSILLLFFLYKKEVGSRSSVFETSVVPRVIDKNRSITRVLR